MEGREGRVEGRGRTSPSRRGWEEPASRREGEGWRGGFSSARELAKPIIDPKYSVSCAFTPKQLHDSCMPQ